jgi:hypothetical protein
VAAHPPAARSPAFAGRSGFCAVVLVQALAGSVVLRGAPPLPVLLAFYTASGTFLGALTGLLVPIMHTLFGAVAVMVIWGFTLYSGVILIMDGPGAYSPRVALFLGLLVGGMAGVACGGPFGLANSRRRPNVRWSCPERPASGCAHGKVQVVSHRGACI